VTKPTPFQFRVAQLRESHLQQNLGSLTATLAHVMAERDAYAEENGRLKTEIDALKGGKK
jgi:hypothetical protein